MIENYFARIDQILRNFPNISSYLLKRKIYNVKQGFISGSVLFENGFRLEFVEVKNTDIQGKIKYRYHFMNSGYEFIFAMTMLPTIQT